MYVQRNIDVPSPNHCYRATAKSITYSEFVFVAFCILHAVRLLDVVIYGLSGCVILFQFIS